MAKRLLAALRAVPRPPSVSQDVAPPPGPGGAAGKKGARKKARRPGGRGAGAQGWSEIDGPPWIDRAKRD